MDLSSESAKNTLISYLLFGVPAHEISDDLWVESIIPEFIRICNPLLPKMPDVKALKDYLNGNLDITDTVRTDAKRIRIRSSSCNLNCRLIFMNFAVSGFVTKRSAWSSERFKQAQLCLCIGHKTWLIIMTDRDARGSSSREWINYAAVIRDVKLYDIFEMEKQNRQRPVGMYILNSFTSLLRHGIEARRRNLEKFETALAETERLKGFIQD